LLSLWQGSLQRMNIRAIIQSLLLLVWALVPMLQGRMVAAPICKATVECPSCCGGKICHCAKSPERLPDSGSQPLAPVDGSKQVSPPAVQVVGEADVAPAGVLACLRLPATAAQDARAVCPVAPCLLYCRFLI